MKSQVNALLHVWKGLHKDVLSAYPDLKGADLDFERIALYCQTRGEGFFTLDLPHLDSLLLRGLEDGRLTLEGPLSKPVSKRVQVPRLFSGLWLRVFDKGSCLRQDADITAIFFLRQLCCIGKKLLVDCSPDRINDTVGRFHNVERTLRRPTLQWDADRLDVDGQRYSLHLRDYFAHPLTDLPLFSSLREEKTEEEVRQEEEDRRLLNQVQNVADLIVSTWNSFDPVSYSADLESESLGIGFKHGTGAVAERISQDVKSRFYSWSAKLQTIFPFELCGKTAGDPRERPVSHELASRLMCVPKTAKGPRLIASEPASQMWCQQLIWSWLQSQLQKSQFRHFIDFRDQSKSGDMVLQASLDRSLATVDLSDASDRLSCWTVERLFRTHSSFLNALHAARTRYLLDEVSEETSFLSLRKFASQGTASTFPVQSLCFLAIALGCSIHGPVSLKAVMEMRGRVRVFGDDIIIPKHGYARLCRVMDLLQLKVNVAKSYVNGHFRESCGTDGFMGHDVTPVKPQILAVDSPAARLAVVDTSNNLFVKGFWNASDSLRSLLPPRVQRGLRIVGPFAAGYAGLASFSGSDESHLKTRWNSRLHRFEVQLWGTSSREGKRDRQGYEALLDFVSNKHSHERARTVSQYAHSRKTRDGLLWEPLNPGARVNHLPQGIWTRFLNQESVPPWLHDPHYRGKRSHWLPRWNHDNAV